MKRTPHIPLREWLPPVLSALGLLLLVVGALWFTDAKAQTEPPVFDCAVNPCTLRWEYPSTLSDGTTPLLPADIAQTVVRWGHCPYPLSGGRWVVPTLHMQASVASPRNDWQIPISQASGDVCVEVSILLRSGYASAPHRVRLRWAATVAAANRNPAAPPSAATENPPP